MHVITCVNNSVRARVCMTALLRGTVTQRRATMVTTKLCYHMFQLSYRQRMGSHTSHLNNAWMRQPAAL